MLHSVFSPDQPTHKEPIPIPGAEITAYTAKIEAAEASPQVLARGEAFSREINQRIVSDFEREGDKMVHVSTFAVIDGTIYMTYYANTQTSDENPDFQSARLVYCPADAPENKTFLEVQGVGDCLDGRPVLKVYDTIFAQVDAQTLFILWTANVDGQFYRLYRPFDLSTKALGEIGVNRIKVGKVINDFSASGIASALAENSIGCKTTYSDIGIMQKFTGRIENGIMTYYTGAYSGDMNFLMKSQDFITWEYVSQPSFHNLSKWENAVYVWDNRCYYFVRQQDHTPYGFLTYYDLEQNKWEEPVLVSDCQSRGDFFQYDGRLYLTYAPIDREHIGILHIHTQDLSQSHPVLQADMKGSCFYPFVSYFAPHELAMSYTVSRRHIRLSRFDGQALLCE